MADIVVKGFFKSIIGLFNLNSRVNHIEEDFTELRKAVRYEVTCDAIVTGINTQLSDIKKLAKETRKDIKELLKRGG